MKDKFIFITPLDEYHVATRINAFFYYLKYVKNLDIEIGVTCTYKQKDLYTAVDFIITLEKSYFDKKKFDYPDYYADRQNPNIRTYIEAMKQYCIENYKDYHVIEYNSFYTEDLVTKERFFPEFDRKVQDWQGETLPRDMGYIDKSLEKTIFYYPFKEDYEKHSKYKDFFSDKPGFILLSRNMKFKHPPSNLDYRFKNLNDYVRKLTENGIKILNIGFPPVHLEIENENYLELNDPQITHNDILGISYYCNGLLMDSQYGGFPVYVCSNLDLFLLTDKDHPWYDRDKNCYDVRKMNNKVDSIDLYNKSIEDVIEILKNCKPKREKKFLDQNKVRYLKEN